jgi:hypothetical protein
VRIFNFDKLLGSLEGYTLLDRKINTNWFIGSAQTKVPVKPECPKLSGLTSGAG